MRRTAEVPLYGNLTAMIDVVFQIIIFFVCTANLQDTAVDTRINLARAPHGKAVDKKNPLEIVVDVNGRGAISIARQPLSRADLAAVLTKAVRTYGRDQIPVVIRGDARATHAMIRGAMDTCAESQIWQIKIAALKEKGR